MHRNRVCTLYDSLQRVFDSYGAMENIGSRMSGKGEGTAGADDALITSSVGWGRIAHSWGNLQGDVYFVGRQGWQDSPIASVATAVSAARSFAGVPVKIDVYDV